jgi:hypothetical protein
MPALQAQWQATAAAHSLDADLGQSLEQVLRRHWWRSNNGLRTAPAGRPPALRRLLLGRHLDR